MSLPFGILRFAPALAAALTGCVMQTEVQAFRVDGAVHAVRVETASGDIRLVPSTSGGVEVEARVSWAGNRPVVGSSYRGGELTVRSPCLDGIDHPCVVDLEIAVPVDVGGQVHSHHGEVWIDPSIVGVEVVPPDD